MILIREYESEDNSSVKRIFSSGQISFYRTAVKIHLFWWPSYILHILYFSILFFFLNISIFLIIISYLIILIGYSWYVLTRFKK
jgi:hypothetical protein